MAIQFQFNNILVNSKEDMTKLVNSKHELYSTLYEAFVMDGKTMCEIYIETTHLILYIHRNTKNIDNMIQYFIETEEYKKVANLKSLSI